MLKKYRTNIMIRPRLNKYLFLHINFLIYSIGGICSKLAATKKFLSTDFIFYYGIILIILFIYAVFWQQILKKMPLNVAFANKSVVIIWGFLWGSLIFGERITIFMIVGAALISIGITLVLKDDE